MVLQCFPTLDKTSLKNPSAPCLGPELEFSAEEFSLPDALLREKKTCHCKYTHQWSKFHIVGSLSIWITPWEPRKALAALPSNRKTSTPKNCTEKALWGGWSTCRPVSNGSSKTVTCTSPHHQEGAGKGPGASGLGSVKSPQSSVPSHQEMELGPLPLILGWALWLRSLLECGRPETCTQALRKPDHLQLLHLRPQGWPHKKSKIEREAISGGPRGWDATWRQRTHRVALGAQLHLTASTWEVPRETVEPGRGNLFLPGAIWIFITSSSGHTKLPT